MDVKREYLDYKNLNNLNNIGEPFPYNFVFSSNETLEIIKKNIRENIITQLEKKIVMIDDLKKNIKKSLDNAIITESTSFDENLYNICETIPFNDIEEKDMKNRVLLSKEITDLIPTNDKSDYEKQVVIGRVKTIEKKFTYNMKPFRILKLSGKTFNWSRIVNDLFISCAYAYAKKIESKKQDELYFPIMLIVDKICFILPNEQDIFKNLTTTKEYIDKISAEVTNISDDKKKFKEECIINPYSTEPQTYPSVTFWEIAILADLFQMHLYKLQTPDDNEQTIYYFSSIDYTKLNDGALLKKFNEDNKREKYELTKINVEWALKSDKHIGPKDDFAKDYSIQPHLMFFDGMIGGYYDKYMKYKNKYINLKNKHL